MAEITLIPLHLPNETLLTYVQNQVAHLIEAPVTISNITVDIKQFYHPQRAQYNAAEILQHIDKQHLLIPAVVCTSIDLFLPIFTHIFGLAKLNGRTAIVSTHRLENSFYGLKEDPDRLEQRLLKEVIHELGHLKGLRHCRQASCVMSSSVSADDLDIKNNFYCPSCLKIISHSDLLKHKNTNFGAE